MKALGTERRFSGRCNRPCDQQKRTLPLRSGMTVVDIDDYKQMQLADCRDCIVDAMQSLFSADMVEDFGGSEELLSCLESLSEKLRDDQREETAKTSGRIDKH